MNRGVVFLFCIVIACMQCKKGTSTPDAPVITNPDDAGLTKTNVRKFMVDPNATKETAALFYNLKTLAKTGFAVGHQDAFSGFYNNQGGASDMKKTTGNDPALLGSDFIFITDKNNNGQPGNWFYQQEENTINAVKQAYSLGMINTFSWHLREPYKETSFYTSEMTENEQAKAFRSILPGGENHNWYKLKLDKVAAVLNKLTGPDGALIPVIFRPFHEFDGNWFWWGAAFCSPDEYKTAYRFTVEYLRDVKKLHHVLYAFSPDNSYSTATSYLSRYPGDKYVDVLGIDNYWDFRFEAGQAGALAANQKMVVVSNLAKEKVKIAAMTETGYQVTSTNTAVQGWFSNFLYTALTNNTEVSFVMFWANGAEGYYVPPPSGTNKADFIEFVNKPKALLQNEMPEMYKIK